MARKGHEPIGETPAEMYMNEAEMKGKPMMHRKSKRGHKRRDRRKSVRE